MNAPYHQPCYGRLFPESLRGDAKGKVFLSEKFNNLPEPSEPQCHL